MVRRAAVLPVNSVARRGDPPVYAFSRFRRADISVGGT
jgi:hypothetical protein